MSLLQKLFRRRKKISDERMAELSKAYWEWLELNPDAYEEGALDGYITMSRLRMYDEKVSASIAELRGRILNEEVYENDGNE